MYFICDVGLQGLGLSNGINLLQDVQERQPFSGKDLACTAQILQNVNVQDLHKILPGLQENSQCARLVLPGKDIA